MGRYRIPFLSVTFGRFPYKYDPMRETWENTCSGAHIPCLFDHQFDQPFARLTGLKLSSDLFGIHSEKLHQDLMLTLRPIFLRIMTRRCRIFGRLRRGKNFQRRVRSGIRAPDFRWRKPNYPRSARTPGIRLEQTPHPIINSSRGIKLMGRMSFDPKPFFTSSFFGKEDLKNVYRSRDSRCSDYPANDSINSTNSNHNNIWGTIPY